MADIFDGIGDEDAAVDFDADGNIVGSAGLPSLDDINALGPLDDTGSGGNGGRGESAGSGGGSGNGTGERRGRGRPRGSRNQTGGKASGGREAGDIRPSQRGKTGGTPRAKPEISPDGLDDLRSFFNEIVDFLGLDARLKVPASEIASLERRMKRFKAVWLPNADAGIVIPPKLTTPLLLGAALYVLIVPRIKAMREPAKPAAPREHVDNVTPITRSDVLKPLW
jgi:hypothetical protein